MERGSDQNSPRIDDELKEEESAFLQGSPDEGRTEGRRQEAPGPGDDAGVGHRPGTLTGEDEASFASYFTPSVFPARRDRLVEDAEEHFASEDLLSEIRQLPDDLYDDVGQLWHAVEQRRAS